MSTPTAKLLMFNLDASIRERGHKKIVHRWFWAFRLRALGFGFGGMGRAFAVQLRYKRKWVPFDFAQSRLSPAAAARNDIVHFYGEDGLEFEARRLKPAIP
jgi:hypothetical protein